MPKFYEIFGQNKFNTNTKNKLIDGICPMNNTLCDGGGNRHQTKINKTEINAILNIETKINCIIPAICSIEYDKSYQKWIVCPRRIFSFPKRKDKTINLNPVIQTHEKSIINKLGFSENIKVGVYPEVYLKFSDDNTDINYHFDYIICELLEDTITLSNLWDMLLITDRKKKNHYKHILRENKLIPTKATDESKIMFFPNLENMAIIEIMTASTSGSNTSKGTDIKSSYLKALQCKPYECPGINKRQVWGRMATQLFAKSSLAESWNTKTYWVVQDELMKNICKTTKLKLNNSNSNSNSNNLINFIKLLYDNEVLIVSDSFSIDSGIDFSGTNTGIDILLPKKSPSKLNLLECMLRSQLSTVFDI